MSEVNAPGFCNEHEGAGFKCRVQQMFNARDHRRRQVAGSRGRQKVIHGRSKNGNSGRE